MSIHRSGTPLSRTTAGTLVHFTNPDPSKAVSRELRAADLLSRAVKVDPQTFMKFVVPPTQILQPQRTSKRQAQLRVSNYHDIFKNLPEDPAKTTESDLSDKFIKAVEAAKLCPGYKFVSTPDSQDPTEPEKLRVDAALFHVEDANLDGRQRWARQVLSIEFKRDGESADPFDDNGEPFEADVSDKRCAVRAQIILYAEMIFAHQHRMFCITILIFGVFARMLRWDRSGAIVTERFNYYEEPEILCEFLWRFSHMSPKHQGYDPSVELVQKDSEDAERMRRLAKKPLATNDYVRGYFQVSLDESWDWYRIRIDEEPSNVTRLKKPSQSEGATSANTCLDDDVQMTDAEGSESESWPLKSRFYLVGKPHFRAPGMAGRGTRGYVAVDCETEEFVFLKDCWRAVADRMEREGDVLQRLNEWPVVNVPTLLCHGDIFPSQWTSTQIHGKDKMPRLKMHIHYRVVVAEVGRPLAEFPDGHGLILVIFDCLRAHQQAYEDCHTIHRDLNIGNFLIMEELIVNKNGKKKIRHRGILTDWELSEPLAQPENELGKPEFSLSQVVGNSESASSPMGARQPDRTGSWQFLSVMLLQQPSKPVCLADEFEAIFNILVYLGIQYLPHDCSDVNSFMHDYFDASVVDNGRHLCSRLKANTMDSGKLVHLEKNIHFGPTSSRRREEYPFNEVIYKLLSWLHSYYAVIQHDRAQAAHKAQPTDDPGIHDTESECGTELDSEWSERLGHIERTVGVDVELAEQKSQAALMTLETQRLEAMNLKSHVPILQLFARYISNKKWPPNDKKPSQLRLKKDKKREKSDARKRTLAAKDPDPQPDMPNKRMKCTPPDCTATRSRPASSKKPATPQGSRRSSRLQERCSTASRNSSTGLRVR